MKAASSPIESIGTGGDSLARGVKSVSAGTSNARALTESREFKGWFADSKVRDPSGNPLIMYHGTYTDFDVFDGEHLAHYFSPDPNQAGRQAKDACEFASMDCVPFSPRILPVYLKASNPFDPRNISCASLMKEWGLGEPVNYDFAEWVYLEDLAIVNKIRALGYDGIWMRQGLAGYDSLAVFDPNQIKSAIGNKGAFDPTNPSITG
jgi:ADP-ribosyltransferase-like protein